MPLFFDELDVLARIKRHPGGSRRHSTIHGNFYVPTRSGLHSLILRAASFPTNRAHLFIRNWTFGSQFSKPLNVDVRGHFLLKCRSQTKHRIVALKILTIDFDDDLVAYIVNVTL